MTGFLHGLLLASLQACLILPWVWLLTALSRRAPAAWLSVLLAGGIVLPLATPWLDRILPGPVVVVPVLERTGLFERDQEILPRESAGEPLPPFAGQAHRERAVERMQTWAFRIWLAGVVIFATGRCWQMLRERLRLGRGMPLASSDPLFSEWKQAARAARLARTPWLMVHPGARSPVTTGILNPVLVLPPDFSQRTLPQRAMIFRHEAEHLARRDLPLRLLLELPRILFWFHPLFPLVLRRYDLEVERACDDAVLRDGFAAKDYAELLVAEAKRRKRAGGGLSTRVKALFSRERSRGWGGSGRVPAGYLLLFAMLVLPVFAVKFRPWSGGDFHPLTPRPAVAAWWRCRGGHGTAVEDWSGNGLHGRIYGASWVKDAERGDCLQFDGVDDVLALPAAPDTSWSRGPFTVAMWLKPAEGSDGGGLLLRGEPNGAWSGAKVHEFNANYVDYGEREIVLAGDIKETHRGTRLPGLRPGFNLFNIIALRITDPLPCGRWTHVAITMTEQNGTIFFQCYLNGTFAGEERFPSRLRSNEDWPTAWWWFGRGESPPVHENHYEGRLSELVVLRTALVESGVRAVMEGRMPE